MSGPCNQCVAYEEEIEELEGKVTELKAALNLLLREVNDSHDAEKIVGMNT